MAIGHVRFSNPTTLHALRSHLLEKGDVLAVARIGGIQAVKDVARTIILAHGGVGVEGCTLEVRDVGASPVAQGEKAHSNAFHAGPATAARPTINHVQSLHPESTADDAADIETDIIEEAKRLASPIDPHGGIRIAVTVETTAKTGVEMEALSGVMGAALNVIDMVKAVDKGVSVEEVKVVGKKGGKSGELGVFNEERGRQRQEKG